MFKVWCENGRPASSPGVPRQMTTTKGAPSDAPSTNPSVVGAPPTSSGAERRCGWCASPLQATRRGTRFCGRKCRQSAFRLRRQHQASATPALATGATFAYADPPYPGMAKRYYENEPTYAGEVDHPALIASLTAALNDGKIAGWALSTSSKALRDVLPLCPPGARVAAWVKPIGVPEATHGPHSTWEPVIVVGGRRLRGGVRDWLRAMPARGGGTLPGRKPIAFCAWLFDLLGMLPGDKIEDLFPGTGVVGRSWDELSRLPAPNDASSGTPAISDGASPIAMNDGGAS